MVFPFWHDKELTLDIIIDCRLAHLMQAFCHSKQVVQNRVVQNPKPVHLMMWPETCQGLCCSLLNKGFALCWTMMHVYW
jgi:hypothetical protein